MSTMFTDAFHHARTGRTIHRFFMSLVILITLTVSLIVAATPARASLCVLKNGNYDISATPCSTADGNGDDIIDLIYNVGEDLELDLVYENEQSYAVELFTYLMFYDTANMDGTTVTCNPDPNDYFNDNFSPTLGLPVCTTSNGGISGDATDDQGIKIVTQTYMNFSSDNWPDSDPSFILDQLVFDNGYTTPSADHNAGSEVYTIDFSTTGGSPTDIGLIFTSGNRCGVLTGAQQCSDEGVTTEAIMQTRLFMDQPPCYIGPPGAASVGKCTFTGTAGTCDTGGAAQTILSLTLPSACYGDSSCSTTSTDCGTYGVSFEATDGTDVSDYTSTSYTDTTPVVGDSLSYTITGVDTTAGCLDSSSLTAGGSCGSSVTVTATGGTCQCGDPPTVTLTDPQESEIGDSCGSSCVTFIQGIDTEIEYLVTDEDGTLPDSIDSVYFFYTGDLSSAPLVLDVTSSLDSAGKLTVTVPGDYMDTDYDLYFAILVTDEDLLTDSYPDSFDCDPLAPTVDCMSANVNKINKDNIIAGSSFAFIPGEEPYPDQLPFRASSGDPLNIYFALNDAGHVSMRIYTMDGMLVRSLENDSATDITDSTTCTGDACNLCNWESGCRWDGSNSAGGSNIVQNGMYIINIHAVSTGENFYGQSIDFTKGLVVMN